MTSTTKWEKEFTKLINKYNKPSRKMEVMQLGFNVATKKFIQSLLDTQGQELERQSMLNVVAERATCEMQKTVLKADILSKVEVISLYKASMRVVTIDGSKGEEMMAVPLSVLEDLKQLLTK